MTTLTVTPTVPAPTAARLFDANVRAEWTNLSPIRSTTWTLLATVGLAIGFSALIGASQIASYVWGRRD